MKEIQLNNGEIIKTFGLWTRQEIKKIKQMVKENKSKEDIEYYLTKRDHILVS